MSASRVPSQRRGLAPRFVPHSRRGPSALPEVLHYYGPSGHPLAFSAVANAYLAAGSFSPRPGGLRQFRYNPSLRAVATAPLGPTAVSASISAAGVAFAKPRETRHPEYSLTRLARRSLPTARKVAPWPEARFVRRHRPRLSPAKRPLSFMVLALTMLGLSPTGLYRLLWSRRGSISCTSSSSWQSPRIASS
jgi:hypothetical protein